MSKIDKEKMREWIDEKKEHIKDYATPVTEKLQPVVEKVKDAADPLATKVKEKTDPMMEKAKVQMEENAKKRQERAEEKRLERERKAAEQAADLGDGSENSPKKKVIAMAAILILVVGLMISIPLIMGSKSSSNDDQTANAEQNEEIHDAQDNLQDETQKEELMLVNENLKPMFTINGKEYMIGCNLGDLLVDEALEIANIDTYLHYNQNALMVPAGKTRDWEIKGPDGKLLKVTILNNAKEEMSSEDCKIVKIDTSNNDDSMNMEVIAGQIKFGMPAKDIVDVLGAVSGKSSVGGVKSYWWNWKPYSNDNLLIRVYVEADGESGNINRITLELE